MNNPLLISTTPVATPAKGALESTYALGHWLLGEERFRDAARVFRVMLRAAPQDERAWLGLGQAHERMEQDRIALELYGAGAVASRSVRCWVARARVFARAGRDLEADDALDDAEQLAEARGDDSLVAFVQAERKALR